jgi:hypothetical protein
MCFISDSQVFSELLQACNTSTAVLLARLSQLLVSPGIRL